MVNHPNRRKAIYATHDADGRTIAQNADIREFATIEAAREWLLTPYQGGGWNMDTAVIGRGRYSDCWLKWMSRPCVGNPGAGVGYAPFAFRQLYIDPPGSHPGGRFWWITPKPDVLVVEDIRESDEC